MPAITDTDLISKNQSVFQFFERNYWAYYLELEEQFLETKRYVAFEQENFKTFSSEYLKLLEAVCSEIDILGKEIAQQIDDSFKKSDKTANIQKWWFVLQNWYQAKGKKQVRMLDDWMLEPWKGYQIEQFLNKTGAKCFRQAEGAKTPKWWTAYTKVKHGRTLDDPDTTGKVFQQANLGNLCNAFAALYILETAFASSVGQEEDYKRIAPSQLFDKQKPHFYFDTDGYLCQVDD